MLAASSLPLCMDWWGELNLEHQLPKHLVPWMHSSAVGHRGVREGELAAGHPMSCKTQHRGLLSWNRLRLLFPGQSFRSSWPASFGVNNIDGLMQWDGREGGLS